MGSITPKTNRLRPLDAAQTLCERDALSTAMAWSTWLPISLQSFSNWLRVFWKDKLTTSCLHMQEKANLDGLIYRLFNVPTDIVDLIDATHRLVGVRNVDGGHVKARPVEAGPFAQLLHYLHHHSLPAKKKPMQTSLKMLFRA